MCIVNLGQRIVHDLDEPLDSGHSVRSYLVPSSMCARTLSSGLVRVFVEAVSYECDAASIHPSCCWIAKNDIMPNPR